jgi:hypothetical protein
MLGENTIALPQQNAWMHESPGAAIQRQVISMRMTILLVVLLMHSERKQRQRLANDHGVPAYGHSWSLAWSYRDLSGIRRWATRSQQRRRAEATRHAFGIRAGQRKLHLRLCHCVDCTCDSDLVTFINRFGKLDLRRAPCQPCLAEAVDQRIRHVGIHRHARHEATTKTILPSDGVIMDLIGTGCRIIVGREHVRLELHTRGIHNA